MKQVIALAGLVLVAACSKGGTTAAAGNSLAAGTTAVAGSASRAMPDALKTEFRAKFVQQCTQSATAASPNKSIDFSALCGCGADKLTASKSPAELMAAPSMAEAQSIMAQCAKEHPPQVS